MNLLKADKLRYGNGTGRGMPTYQKYWRKAQMSTSFLHYFYAVIFISLRFIYHCDIPLGLKVGPGLYIGHPFCIVINPETVIGKSCNLSKGVTIGQANRGQRKGSPLIGNNVWIGTNAVIVGKISIGDDVLIAPNAFVNCDVPSHSIVIGNPCIIKHRDNATQGYI